MNSVCEGSVNVAVANNKNASEKAMKAVRDLGDHALSTVLALVGVERLFLRELSALEISGLCCMFPKVREWFLENHPTIGSLPKTLDVAALFNCVPSSAALEPLLEAFEPHSVAIRFEKNENRSYDVLLAFDPLKSFYSLEVKFGQNGFILIPGRYSVRKLSIVQNRWNPCCAGAQTVFSGVSGVKEIILTYGFFDVVMAAHLEHQRFTHLELREVGVSQFEVSQIASWLVSRDALKHLVVFDFPYWVDDSVDVRFYGLLLSRIHELRGLQCLEFSIGGRFIHLSGLLRLRHLRRLRINIEIHLAVRLLSTSH